MYPDLTMLPRADASLAAVEHLFNSRDEVLSVPPPNPHHEPQVEPAARRMARSAAVLMLLCGEREPTLLLTERSAALRYAGHQVFPGGLADKGDVNARATMWREVREETGLQPRDVRLLGRLADYYTHSGYRIAAFIGAASQPPALQLAAGEVASAHFVALSTFCDGASYRLRARSENPYRANYYVPVADVVVTGPTLSLLIALYRGLLRTQGLPDA
ncbi:MAG: CoA pyrophosphatase [Pseudomonadota bacterium]